MVVCRFRALLVVALTLACVLAFARQSADVLNRSVVLSTQKVRLDTLLQNITRQTGIRFSYNSKRLNTAYRLSVNTKKMTARDALDQLKNKTGVLYSLVENHVILNIEKSTIQKNPSDIPPSPGITQPTSLKPVPPTSSGKGEQQKKTTTLSDTSSAAGSTLLPLPDTIVTLQDSTVSQINSAVLPPHDSSASHFKTIERSTPRDSSARSSTPIVKPKVNQKKAGYFIDLGINSEETLFMGTTLRMGTTSVFGTISIKSNGSAAILLYGLSGSLRSGDRSKIVMNTYFGTYSKSFRTTTISVDTVISDHRIGVSGLWAGINGGIEWKLNAAGSWKLFAGVSFNALESKHKVDGKSQGLSGMPGSNPERKYSAFYPFYTLSNTYDDTSFASLKTWMGIHVGLYRTIFSR